MKDSLPTVAIIYFHVCVMESDVCSMDVCCPVCTRPAVAVWTCVDCWVVHMALVMCSVVGHKLKRYR